MLYRICRQYRRFILGCGLLFLLIYLEKDQIYAEYPDIGFSPIIDAISITLAIFIIVGGATAVLALFLPTYLPMIEIIGLSALLHAILLPHWHTALQLVGGQEWLDILLIVGLVYLLERVIYGDWHPKRWRRDLRPRSTTITVSGTPDDIWKKLIPDPNHSQSFYWPGATFLPPDRNSTCGFILILPRRSQYKDAIFEVEILKSEEPLHFIYQETSLSERAEVACRFEYQIEPIDRKSCRIKVTRQLLDVPPGRRLFLYLTNDFRDFSASLHARLNGRADRTIIGSQIAPARKQKSVQV